MDYLNTALLGVLGSSMAVNAFFLREAWRELREIRNNDHDQDVKLENYGVRLDRIELKVKP